MSPSNPHKHTLMLLCCAAMPLLPIGTHASNLAAYAAITHSQLPPGELAVKDVPQFVMLGFDDNPDTEPMEWLLDFLDSRKHADGSPVRVIFYTNGKYLEDNPALQQLHLRAFKAGHEIGNHTQSHFGGADFTVQAWVDEIQRCQQTFESIGIPAAEVTGFRAPFLAYNDNTFAALERLGMRHDSSIEEGYQADHDGTNFLWPYTLHAGSPGNAAEFGANPAKRVGQYPSLFQIPIHVFIVPDDAQCTAYGVPTGMRDRAARHLEQQWDWKWSTEEAKLSGLDWNVLEMASLDPDAFLAILKYNLDLRRAGNKAPMMVGAHSAMYPATLPERRRVIEAFVNYALSFPDVRIVTPTMLMQWMRSPAPIQSTTTP